MHEVLRDTHNADPKIRAAALLQLCPCQLRTNVKEAWIRHFEIIYDSDAKVRSIALHNMCDGSPAELETNVVSAVEYLTKDTDKKIRRRARRVMAVYRRTGKINQDKAESLHSKSFPHPGVPFQEKKGLLVSMNY